MQRPLRKLLMMGVLSVSLLGFTDLSFAATTLQSGVTQPEPASELVEVKQIDNQLVQLKAIKINSQEVALRETLNIEAEISSQFKVINAQVIFYGPDSITKSVVLNYDEGSQRFTGELKAADLELGAWGFRTMLVKDGEYNQKIILEEDLPAAAELKFSVVEEHQPSLIYTDLKKDDWFRPYIEELTLRGIVNGKAQGIFDPYGEVTRAELAKMVVAGLGLELKTGVSSFTDVGDRWYRPWIETAYFAGLVSGHEGKFRPEDPVTREEIAVIMGNALSLQASVPFADTSVLEPYTDKAEISHWATDQVAKAVQSGIIIGQQEAILAPGAHATRAEAITMLKRLLDVMEK